jgi:hypothetical protein
MSVKFFYPDGRQMIFQKLDRKKYRGVLLPGSEVLQSDTSTAVITLQELSYQRFNISYRLLEIFQKSGFQLMKVLDLGLKHC